MSLFSGMNDLWRLGNARSRSISPENFNGEKGRGGMAEEGLGRNASRDLGRGWKVSPSVKIEPGETLAVADIEGPGAIQHLWMTVSGIWRSSILRIYWDDQDQPSVECPVGDFFASGWGNGIGTGGSPMRFAQISSLAVCVNPGSAFNCYWPMPFRKRCRMTVENRNVEAMTIYYQVDYALDEVPDDAAYFHAQFRRVNPLPFRQVYTIVDGIRGKGQYVGTSMAWGVNNSGWWGEGEIKFYLDGDIPEDVPTAEAVAEHGGSAYPTICGTGTEDYFCGSYNFENQQTRQYQEFTTPYAGMPQVIRPDGVYAAQTRFSLYRWHVADPIRFERDLRVTIQALGWRQHGRYLPLQDDIASVAYWYQTLPTSPFPRLPDRDYLEVI